MIVNIMKKNLTTQEMRERYDNLYCGFIGGASGLISWFNQIGIDETFIGTLIKTAGIAAVSTIVGLILKEIWYMIFHKKIY